MAVEIGFIGAGKMASAIVEGIVSKGLYKRSEIVACAKTQKTIKRAERELGIKVYPSAEDVAKRAKLIVLAVKPQQIDEVLNSNSVNLFSKSVLISVLAGVKISTLKSYVPDCKIVRVMPNLCCSVFEGVSCYSIDKSITVRDEAKIKKIFGSVGLAVKVKEKDLDAVTGLSGSSPAYVFMVIDALAEAGVKEGLSPKVSRLLAAQTVLGSAKTVLESKKTPDQLKTDVCSPGGTTIEGVKVLEKANVKKSFVEAVQASAEKSRKMSKK